MAKITQIHRSAEPARLHFLNEWMDKRGVKQADLVRELGVDKGTVSKWCAGKLPQETNLIAIAAFFEIEPNDLFRHPDDDWLSRFFRDRSQEELNRMIETLKAAFPRKDGTNG